MLIHRHCAYIDTRQRALLFAKHLCLETSFDASGRQLGQITQLYLRPFQHVPQLNHSIYEEYDGTAAVLDRTTMEAVDTILKVLAPHLKRLVIDIPLRGLYPEDDHDNVRPMLHQSFMALRELEEFTSLNDELYLATARSPRVSVDDTDDEASTDTEQTAGTEVITAQMLQSPETPQQNIWACWPKLRYLSLYNLSLGEEEDVWRCIKAHPELEKLVLVRAEPSIVDEETNIKLAWSRAPPTRSRESRKKQLSIAWIDSVDDQPNFGSFIQEWSLLDPEDNVLVFYADTPNTADGIVSNKAIVRSLALEGRLFDHEATGAIETRRMRLTREQRILRSQQLLGHYL